ncbi:MAG: hypothetical protein U0414_39600 [Polyangiaceae bacterium]
MGVITIPIWDGGARYGAHRTTKAEVEQSGHQTQIARHGEISQSAAVVVASDARDLAEARPRAREQRLADLA